MIGDGITREKAHGSCLPPSPEKQPCSDQASVLALEGRYPVRAKVTIPSWINVPEVGLGSATSKRCPLASTSRLLSMLDLA